MNGPSDAAVEAAAEVLGQENRDSAKYRDMPDPAMYTSFARAALEAALPIIREELAQEIEHLDAHLMNNSHRTAFLVGTKQAARIVRAGEGA